MVNCATRNLGAVTSRFGNRHPSGREIHREAPPTAAPRAAGDRYGMDVLSSDPHRVGPGARRPHSKPIPAKVGMVLEDVASGYVGEVMEVGRVAGNWQMELEDRRGRRKSFSLGPGFWLDGEPVDLQPPAPKAAAPQGKIVAGHQVTASGSLHVKHAPRVARPSRIWVEGKHDAELIGKVWGEDLAYEGIVIEELFGADHLYDVLAVFGPTNKHRAGVLLDHLVPGSKESRIAAEAMKLPGVLVLGHPYVDVWQAVKPAAIGIKAWPNVPRGEDIKTGTLSRLGWPSETTEDIGLGWKRILDSVHSYKDLEPSLLGRMEELIDFVAAGL